MPEVDCDGENASMAPARVAGRLRPGTRQRTPDIPVHSADLMVTSLSTGRAEGQALVHLAQSIQAGSERRIRNGLSREVRPSSRSVGTQITAPEILHPDRRYNQDGENDG